MLDICLVGCGGMMPLPRRWLTALMTRYNGSSLLIDCGEGTQVAIKERAGALSRLTLFVLRISRRPYQRSAGTFTDHGEMRSAKSL